MDASKHLLEMFLESRDVLAVANDLEKILVSDKVESETENAEIKTNFHFCMTCLIAPVLNTETETLF